MIHAFCSMKACNEQAKTFQQLYACTHLFSSYGYIHAYISFLSVCDAQRSFVYSLKAMDDGILR